MASYDYNDARVNDKVLLFLHALKDYCESAARLGSRPQCTEHDCFVCGAVDAHKGATLPCGHAACVRCFYNWSKEGSRCPSCNAHALANSLYDLLEARVAQDNLKTEYYVSNPMRRLDPPVLATIMGAALWALSAIFTIGFLAPRDLRALREHYGETGGHGELAEFLHRQLGFNVAGNWRLLRYPEDDDYDEEEGSFATWAVSLTRQVLAITLGSTPPPPILSVALALLCLAIVVSSYDALQQPGSDDERRDWSHEEWRRR